MYPRVGVWVRLWSEEQGVKESVPIRGGTGTLRVRGSTLAELGMKSCWVARILFLLFTPAFVVLNILVLSLLLPLLWLGFAQSFGFSREGRYGMDVPVLLGRKALFDGKGRRAIVNLLGVLLGIVTRGKVPTLICVNDET